MTTFRSKGAPTREYSSVQCEGCGQCFDDQSIAEYLRQHGPGRVVIWCVHCGCVQTMRLRTVVDPAELRGGVAVERLVG